ncbi:MAG: amidohydrolase [Caldilineales bacterium]|nr:amidohydrolase [Caldilineales bacterium]
MNDYLLRAQDLRDELVAWRRDFHRHPELGFEEHRTAAIVAGHLQKLGIETTTGVGKTGVVGLIEGVRPGPTVLLRVDMDALPVHEATGLPFASETPGKMHACGHDGHTAIGMGVAQMLAETSANWPGCVKLLFQPAEEGLGGALATIASGVLQNPAPDMCFGLHLWNPLPAGRVIVQPGPFMAAADHFEVSIRGRGAHGAQPELAVDAILVAAEAVGMLHTIVSRNLPPQETAVLSVGSFHAGKAFNVIAEEAIFDGTLRTFDAAVRDRLIERMQAILAGVCQAYEAAFDLRFFDYTPAVDNDLIATRIALAAATEVVGAEALLQITPLMVAEDMSEIMNRVPGCYIMVGADPGTEGRGTHHNPRFDIDEAQLPVAAAILAATAVRFLEQGQSGTGSSMKQGERP